MNPSITKWLEAGLVTACRKGIRNNAPKIPEPKHEHLPSGIRTASSLAAEKDLISAATVGATGSQMTAHANDAAVLMDQPRSAPHDG
jgi:hypothetical protein